MPTPAEALLARLEPFGVRLGLERTRGLLRRLGDPHRRFAVVLVAGTNGKGSVAALLAAIAQAAGYRTGLYTSPHLESVHERIRCDGRAIEDGELAASLEEAIAAASDDRELPTCFEALTVVAFRHFAEVGVELGVVEVGLGGRFDATNATEPILSLLTSIDLDHQERLGRTLAAIAREKAGVMRAGRPTLAAPQRAPTLRALEEAAAGCGSRLRTVDAGVEPLPGHDAAALPQRLRLTTGTASYDLELPLAGDHQRGNLALAVQAAESLKEIGWEGFGHTAILRGVGTCQWPGRLEWLTLPGGRRVLLDAAHNPAGIRSLVAYLRTCGDPCDLLFGALREKAVERMLPPLLPHVGTVVLTRPAEPTGGEPGEWRDLVDRPAVVETDPTAALDRALGLGHGPLLVCGSIYLVGLVRRVLRLRGATSASERPG